MYKINIAGIGEIAVELGRDKVLIDGVEYSPDWLKLDNNRSHLIVNNESYNAEVLNLNRENKSFAIKINGRIYEGEIKDQYDELLYELGMDAGVLKGPSEIKAPMPGLVLEVFVTAGQKVLKGDNLMVLEAMKMENILKAQVESTVKSVVINSGQKVEKNQVLIILE